MGKNYLPFANRAILEVDNTGTLWTTYGTQPVLYGSMDIGVQSGGRAILQDLSVYAISEERATPIEPGELGIKYGWLQNGFLQQRHIPVDVLMDGGIDLYRNWTFPRPYRLFAKEQMKVRAQYPDPATGDVGICGVAMNGVRVATDEPFILHAANIDDTDTKRQWLLAGRTMRAPDDSDIDIHSVCFANTNVARSVTTGIAYQVEGPGRRNWFKASSQQLGLVDDVEMEQLYWAAPWSSVITLGEHDGWFMHHGQSFLVDIRNFSGEKAHVALTLRGSLEVDDDRIVE